MILPTPQIRIGQVWQCRNQTYNVKVVAVDDAPEGHFSVVDDDGSGIWEGDSIEYSLEDWDGEVIRYINHEATPADNAQYDLVRILYEPS